MITKGIKGVDVKKLAVFMHNSYEKFAKEEGWKTQKDCQVEFDKLPEANQRVMYKMAAGIINWIDDNQEDRGKMAK